MTLYLYDKMKCRQCGAITYVDDLVDMKAELNVESGEIEIKTDDVGYIGDCPICHTMIYEEWVIT